MKRTVSLLLAAIMLLGAFGAAFAQGADTVTLTLSSVEDVRPGDVVAMTLELGGADYLAHTLMLHLYYNADMLSVVRVSKGSVWLGLPEDAMITCDTTTHTGEVAFGIVSPMEAFTGHGEVFTVFFTVKQGCTADLTVELNVTDFYYYPINGSAQWVDNVTQDGVIHMHVEQPTDPYSGSCGSGVFWKFDPETGTLTVYGQGRMDDYAPFNPPPWQELKPEITSVVIEEGVVSVGNLAFCDCPELTFVSFPKGIKAIGFRAFSGCSALSEALFEAGPASRCTASAFNGCAEDFAVYFYTAFGDEWVIDRTGMWHGCTALAICTVTFCDWDGTVLSVQQVVQYRAAEAPEGYEFIREGYTWVGWDKDYTCIKWDTVVTAAYDINKYTVTFVDEAGNIIEQQQVEHGADAVMPVLASESHHYEFFVDGQPFDGRNITHDITVTATVNINVYTVTFYSEEIGVIYSVHVEHGGSVSLPGLSSVSHHYEFTAEGQPFTGQNITHDVTVIVTTVINTYTVTFVDEAGAVISEQQVEHGADAVMPVLASESHHYEFSVNGAPFTGQNITGSVTVTAAVCINIYTVTFVDMYGGVLSQQQVEHGAAASAPEAPRVEGYWFTGWDNDYGCVTGDMTVTATYIALLYGDANGDGQVTFADLTAVRALLLGSGSLSEYGMLCADVNGDGAVTVADLTMICWVIVQG